MTNSNEKILTTSEHEGTYNTHDPAAVVVQTAQPVSPLLAFRRCPFRFPLLADDVPD
jgi:hypothetical protein